MALHGERDLFQGPYMRLVLETANKAAAIARRLVRRAGVALAQIAAYLEPAWQWLSHSWLGRIISTSLRRRILISNFVGLAILVLGWMLVSQQNVWLIDAKRDALRVQSRIIAAAIASSGQRAFANTGDFDPDRMADSGVPKGFNETTDFKDLDLSIRPELVTPILANVIKGTKTRARIYAGDGTPIVDSRHLLRSGDLKNLLKDPSTSGELVKPKNFWTRLLSWRVRSDLTVYQDIEGINGRSFREFQKALDSGTSQALILMSEDGEQMVGYITPIERLGKRLGVLMLSTKPGEIDDLLFEERMRILTLVALACFATLAVSLLLAHTVAGPMRRLSDAAERVSHDFSAARDLPDFPGREDEIGQMARSFWKMTDALGRRIEASDKFAADVAHELKNPLTAARSTAEALAYAKTDAQREDLVQTVNNELARLNRLISDVSAASRLDADLARQQMSPVEINAVAKGVVETFRDLYSDDPRNLKVVFENRLGGVAARVSGHEGRLGQVMTNLIDNAISFSPQNGTVQVTLSATPDNQFQIDVEDEGNGVPPDQLEAIFERFYTFRPSEFSSRTDNSGLGLSISREIIAAHGGKIWAENRSSRGARFVIRLPRLDAPRRTASGRNGRG